MTGVESSGWFRWSGDLAHAFMFRDIVKTMIPSPPRTQRERVVAPRHGQAVDAWPEGLRRRSTVSVVYAPGR
jgi:hypothetical protein